MYEILFNYFGHIGLVFILVESNWFSIYIRKKKDQSFLKHFSS